MKLTLFFVCVVVVSATSNVFEDLITKRDENATSTKKDNEATSSHFALLPTPTAAPSSDIVASTNLSVDVKPNQTLTIQPCE